MSGNEIFRRIKVRFLDSDQQNAKLDLMVI